MNVKFLAFLLNLLLLLPSFSISAQHLLKLTRVDLLEQLGLNNENTSAGASEDGRLDALLAFGTSLYTGQLEIGTPPQGTDFLLNFAGNLPFPSHGDFSFVASSACDQLAPCQCKDTFNASASTSFQSKSDVGFHTKLSSGNGVRLPIQLFGRYAEEQITFAKALNFQEPWLGQVEMVQGSLFNRLPFDGMVSLGRRSPLVARVESLHLQLHSGYGYLLLNGKLGTGCGQWSEWSELGDKPFARPNSDAFQFTLTQVSLMAPKSVYKDDDKRQALLNPNSPFLQGPAKSVQTMARQINAVKQRLGSQELYTISCAEDYGPMVFFVGEETIALNIPKEKLNIALPSAAALLPRGRCLWAIQELPAPDHAADYWILGRPVFEQYCISLDVISKTIGFASINDE